jgi:hypothetical protein
MNCVRFEVLAAVRIITTLLSPEDGSSILLRNAGIYRRVYTASKPTRSSS